MEIKTQYVRNLLVETPYARRRNIYALMTIEEWVNQRPTGFASGMYIHNLRSEYPIDWDFIRREINEGYVASPEEIKKAFADQAAQKREARIRAEAERAEQEAARRREWSRAGGQP